MKNSATRLVASSYVGIVVDIMRLLYLSAARLNEYIDSKASFLLTKSQIIGILTLTLLVRQLHVRKSLNKAG
jgi:hypothetical protein